MTAPSIRVTAATLPPPIHGIRPLGVADIPALLELAREAIPDTMAARLGPRFADRYHRALLDEPELHLDGYFEGERLMGFIVYTHDVHGALRSAFRRHVFTFGSALLFAMFSPQRLAFVLRIAGSVLARLPEPGMDVRAELLTIAVRKAARGGSDRGGAGGGARGVSVAHALITRAFDYLESRGAPQVKVFCKPISVDPVANGFVRKEGFTLRGAVVRWGLPTNLYVKELASAVTTGDVEPGA